MTRGEIHQLLRDTVEQKLLQADPAKLLATAEKAYRLASGNGAAHPWRQLAAYRLAQVLMRDPLDSVERLKRILELFEEASGLGDLDPIGPLPLIYQLPVLHRLHQLDSRESRRYEQKQEEAFQKAAWRLSSGAEKRVSETRFFLRLQSGAFNMLELSSFFIGLDYQRLSGIGHQLREGDFNYHGKWCIVSNRDVRSGVTFDEAFAEAELRDLLKRDPSATGFRARRTDVQGHVAVDDTTWEDWGPERAIHYLAIKMNEPNTTSTDLAGQLNIEPENCRQLRSRSKRKLQTTLDGRLSGLELDDLVLRSCRQPVYIMVEKTVLTGRLPT